MARTWAINHAAQTYEQALMGGAMPYISTMLGAGLSTARITQMTQSSYAQLSPADVAALVSLAQERRQQGEFFQLTNYAHMSISDIPLNPTVGANRVTVSIRVRRTGAQDGHVSEYYCTCTQTGSVPDASSIGYCVEGCQEALDQASPQRAQDYSWESEVTAIERGKFFGR